MSKAPAYWQTRGLRALLLMPIAALFGLLSACRRWCYRAGVFRIAPSPIPVIIVGNISVGGTGKTPLTQALISIAKQRGIKAGIVSRGHGGQHHDVPYLICDKTTTSVAGDEPLMHFLKTGGPVVVCADRPAAVAKLHDTGATLAISDDGLQHYRMQRSTEIAVVDGESGFLNGLLLPAGPLREPLSRLASVDIIAVQTPPENSPVTSNELVNRIPALRAAKNAAVSLGSFSLSAGELKHLWTNETRPTADFAGRSVFAVAGIGSPSRFFRLLKDAGLNVQSIEHGDHHLYQASDFESLTGKPVIVTGKDAVKLRELALHDVEIYELDVQIELSNELDHAVQAIFNSHASI